MLLYLKAQFEFEINVLNVLLKLFGAKTLFYRVVTCSQYQMFHVLCGYCSLAADFSMNSQPAETQTSGTSEKWIFVQKTQKVRFAKIQTNTFNVYL